MKTSSGRVEPMRSIHLDAIVEIETASFTNPWPREAFERELSGSPRSRPVVLIGHEPTLVVGYCICWRIEDELHIQNLAVHPAHRGEGAGRFLLASVLDRARSEGAVLVQLEVRRSNRVARRLYTSFSFRVVGERRGYYSSPREDAVILEKRLREADKPA